MNEAMNDVSNLFPGDPTLKRVETHILPFICIGCLLSRTIVILIYFFLSLITCKSIPICLKNHLIQMCQNLFSHAGEVFLTFQFCTILAARILLVPSKGRKKSVSPLLKIMRDNLGP